MISFINLILLIIFICKYLDIFKGNTIYEIYIRNDFDK